jgi:hypothetical protein
MALKCGKCGHEGLRDEFKFICRVADPGPDAYRRCPKCKSPVYSEELEQDKLSGDIEVWGLSSLRGEVFKSEPEDKE